MLTLNQVKAHLKIPLTDVSEDMEVALYLASAEGAFFVESKRRWPEAGEPAIMAVIDPAATPPTYRFVRYTDPAVLAPPEQAIALQWMLLAVGHWHENRQSVVVDVRAVTVEVSDTCQKLMSLLRDPTL